MCQQISLEERWRGNCLSCLEEQGEAGVCNKPAGLIIVVVGSNRCAVDQLCVNRLVWRSAGEAGGL
jgi:hypothetical protein